MTALLPSPFISLSHVPKTSQTLLRTRTSPSKQAIVQAWMSPVETLSFVSNLNVSTPDPKSLMSLLKIEHDV